MAKTPVITQSPRRHKSPPPKLHRVFAMGWTMNATTVLVIKEKHRVSAVTITDLGSHWAAVVVQSARPAKGVPITAEAVLAQHGHHDLGMFPTLPDAMAAAEAWVLSRPELLAACECGEIESEP